MRIVLDTNVYLSAFTAQGLSQPVFEHCLEEHDLLISQEILSEFAVGLRRKFKMPAGLVETLVSFVRGAGILEEVSPIDPASCRDRSDLHILGLAVQAKADVIVSGDLDLWEIRPFQAILILSPRQFWERERTPRKWIQSRRARYRKKG
jgi:putative PIN family toxin of toxin-antitoxin system